MGTTFIEIFLFKNFDVLIFNPKWSTAFIAEYIWPSGGLNSKPPEHETREFTVQPSLFEIQCIMIVKRNNVAMLLHCFNYLFFKRQQPQQLIGKI